MVDNITSNNFSDFEDPCPETGSFDAYLDFAWWVEGPLEFGAGEVSSFYTISSVHGQFEGDKNS